MTGLAERVLAGDWLALSRLITRIEDGEEDFQKQLDILYSHTGSAHIIGVTGPSGTGKSTLVNCLAGALQRMNKQKLGRIGIIAVDPTSPFTGGALLGDRVRMRDLSSDSNIFIRSMATRGALGGIAKAVDNAVLVMDAAGFKTIIIETVGAGQSEVEIASLAHTTIVVEAPGLGDDIQAAKAGILEIADILVVNKADKTNADNTVAALEGMLSVSDDLNLKKIGHRWRILVIKTSALNYDGIENLAEIVGAHYDFLQSSGAWEKCNLQRFGKQVDSMLYDTLFERWKAQVDQKEYNALMIQVMQHKLSPHQAVQKLLA